MTKIYRFGGLPMNLIPMKFSSSTKVVSLACHAKISIFPYCQEENFSMVAFPTHQPTFVIVFWTICKQSQLSSNEFALYLPLTNQIKYFQPIKNCGRFLTQNASNATHPSFLRVCEGKSGGYPIYITIIIILSGMKAHDGMNAKLLWKQDCYESKLCLTLYINTFTLHWNNYTVTLN